MGAPPARDGGPLVRGGTRDRRRAGGGTGARRQPLGDLDLGRTVRGPDAGGGGAVQLPDGGPGHRWSRSVRGPKAAERRGGRAGRGRAACGRLRCGPRVRPDRDLGAAPLPALELAHHLRGVSHRGCRDRGRGAARPLTGRTGVDVIKQLRQRAIRDLVVRQPIRTQQELAAVLRERGFRATQATISRDIAELGLVKAERTGIQAYALPRRLVEAETTGEERLRALLHDLPVELRDAGSLLVIRTLPGSAHAIAAALDRARWPEVAGSIGGDDTVFVAIPDRAALLRVRARLAEMARLDEKG